MAKCPYCSNLVTLPIGRSTICPSCKKELHSCLCCEYYSPSSHWDCRENINDPVTDKERGNFCDFFMLKTKPTETKNTSKAEEARKKLEALFG